MRKTISKVFFGLLVIALGVIFGGNVMGIWDIDVLFPGWWTLFIILPCIYLIITNGPDAGNITGLAVGVLLLLSKTETFGKYISRKLIFPAAVVIIGVCIIVSAVRTERRKRGMIYNTKSSFSSKKLIYDGKPFDGGAFKCVFGEMVIDISGAVINQTEPLKIFCLFGETRVILPKNVSLELKSSVVFGEIENEYPENDCGIPLCIDADCSFGAIRIIEK